MSDTVQSSGNNGKIIVHLGAHRTGTTLFQEYLYKITPFARSRGYSLVGINQTRSGLMAGLLGHTGPQGMQSQEVAKSLNRLENLILEAKTECRGLVISDENIMGAMESNLESSNVYADLPRRMVILRQAFRHVDRFYLSIRDLDSWWTSCLSYLISTKYSPPVESKISEIGACPRSWKDVVSDIMFAYPQARIIVREFTHLTANPKRQLIKVSNWKDFEETKRLGKQANKSKDQDQLRKILIARGDLKGAARLGGATAYCPFLPDQVETLQRRYQEDLAWLRINVSGNDKFLETHA